MTIAYYSPEAKNRLYTIENTESIGTEVLEVAKNLATIQGFKPVSNYTDVDVYEQVPFACLRVEYKLSEDGESYEQVVTEQPILITLNRGKLLTHPMVVSMLTTATEALQQSPALAKWWTDEATYLRGSPMAQAAIEAFGVTQADLEAIVKDCLE